MSGKDGEVHPPGAALFFRYRLAEFTWIQGEQGGGCSFFFCLVFGMYIYFLLKNKIRRVNRSSCVSVVTATLRRREENIRKRSSSRVCFFFFFLGGGGGWMTSVLLSDDEIFLRTSKDRGRQQRLRVHTLATDGDVCFFLFFFDMQKGFLPCLIQPRFF